MERVDYCLYQWGSDLGKEHERYLVSQLDNIPCFVTDFPAAIKPFYARMNNDCQNTVSSKDNVEHSLWSGKVVKVVSREWIDSTSVLGGRDKQTSLVTRRLDLVISIIFNPLETGYCYDSVHTTIYSLPTY